MKIVKYMVIYGVSIRFWPTLVIAQVRYSGLLAM